MAHRHLSPADRWALPQHLPVPRAPAVFRSTTPMADAAIPSKHTRIKLMNNPNQNTAETLDLANGEVEKNVAGTVASLDDQITAVEGQLEALRAQRREIGKVAQTRTQRAVKYTAIALTGVAVVGLGLRLLAGRTVEAVVDAALDA